jgi:hypothetical protein
MVRTFRQHYYVHQIKEMIRNTLENLNMLITTVANSQSKT